MVGRDVNVKAAMLSQPTLPILMKSELAVPQAAITKANDRKAKFVGARFQQDRKSPLVKMERLDSGLTYYNRHNIPSPEKGAHAVLTSWFKDEPGDPTRQALDDLLAIFKAELKGKP